MKNIIFLVIDGFRNDHLKEDITPNLYALSKKGLHFEKAYALGPWSLHQLKDFLLQLILLCMMKVFQFLRKQLH